MAHSLQDAVQWTFDTFVYSTTRENSELQPSVAEHLALAASLPAPDQKSAVEAVTRDALKFLRIFDNLHALSTGDGLTAQHQDRLSLLHTLCMRCIPGADVLLALLPRYDAEDADTIPPLEHMAAFLDGGTVTNTVFHTAAVAAAGQSTLVRPTIDQAAVIAPLPPLDGITQIVFPVDVGGDEGYTCAIATFCRKD